MEITEAINAVIKKQDLTEEQMQSIMRTIMTGGATDAQIGGFLIGLRMKGETVNEITAAASVMRELAASVEVDQTNLVDTCNISTASAFVVAAAGAKVAKHGNRSISSKSGSADVLEAAGVRLDLTPEQVAKCVNDIGVGFMFAPAHHGAMKHAIGPRKEMAARTIFNVLGPLTNPASAPNQVLGVFADELLETMASVLQKLGSRHVLVVHARDGLDEISVGDKTEIAELKDGHIRRYSVQPEDFGFNRTPISELKADSAEHSLEIIRHLLEDQPGPARDIVALNAGAAVYAAGIADSLKDGVARAKEAIASGEARNKLDQLVILTQSF
ncbi:MAG: anthranilate phosphoribosyltransferase [Gammaproteobacteria bacterium]